MDLGVALPRLVGPYSQKRAKKFRDNVHLLSRMVRGIIVSEQIVRVAGLMSLSQTVFPEIYRAHLLILVEAPPCLEAGDVDLYEEYGVDLVITRPDIHSAHTIPYACHPGCPGLREAFLRMIMGSKPAYAYSVGCAPGHPMPGVKVISERLDADVTVVDVGLDSIPEAVGKINNLLAAKK